MPEHTIVVKITLSEAANQALEDLLKADYNSNKDFFEEPPPTVSALLQEQVQEHIEEGVHNVCGLPYGDTDSVRVEIINDSSDSTHHTT